MISFSASMTAGSITSVLIGVPGDAPNVATVLDGYAMTKKGQAGRALGAALGASVVGSIIGGLLAIVMIPVIKPLVLMLLMGDYVFLLLLGLCFVTVLGRESTLKGLISAGFGIIFALVGLQPSTGVDRFAFGLPFLFDGIPFVLVAMGLFAAAETFEVALSTETSKRDVVPQAKSLRRDMLMGCKDIWTHKWVSLRSCLAGYGIGVIPGLGSTIAAMVGYAVAKYGSKHPEKYGTGVIEGVIGPEIANNSTHGSALLTTLAFGIPHSAMTAMLLGGFIMVGIQPGPNLLIEHLSLCFTLLWGTVVTNIIVGIICFLALGYIAKMLNVQPFYTVTAIIVLIFVGAYSQSESYESILIVMAFGAIGILMKKFGYPRVCLVLGMVLGGLFENYLYLALHTAGPLFFLRTTSLIIIALIIAIFVAKPVINAARSRLAIRIKS